MYEERVAEKERPRGESIEQNMVAKQIIRWRILRREEKEWKSITVIWTWTI